MKNVFVALPFMRQVCFLLLTAFPFISQAQVQADFFMNRSGGCSPLTVSFTNNTTGTSANAVFKWNLGNGNIAYLKNPSAIYREEKTYSITLTVTDGTQTSIKTKTVTVYKKPIASFGALKPKVCIPAAAQFISNSAAGDGTVTGYQWDFGDGTTQQGFGNNINHYYTYEQTPTVSLTVTNTYGCQASITKPNTVEILPKIDAVFTSDKTMLCSIDETIQLTNNSTGPGTLSYLWNFGDGTTSTLKDPVHRFTKRGVYSIRLTVSNTVGCSVTSNSLAINAAYFNTDFVSRSLCREVSFTSSSYLSPTATLWKFGDGTTSASFYTATHVYAAAGTYNVTLINTYGACKDTIVKQVVISDLVLFNSDITMPASVCQNSSNFFTSTSSVPPVSIKWDFGDGANFTTSYPATSHTYSQPGTYTVTVVNIFGTCSETVSKIITVHALPATTGFLMNYGGVCGAPVTVQFSDTTQGAIAWQWSMDYRPFSTQQNASYNFTGDGYHAVHLTVTNAAGCKKTVSKAIDIISPSVIIYYTYSSSPRGAYDCDSLTMKFAVHTNQPIQSYSWSFGNGITSTSATPQASFLKEGIYQIVLNYITVSGCAKTATYGVRVYGKPKASFAYNIPCGNSLNLQFMDYSYFSDGWNWTFGDGGSDYGLANPNHTYSDTGKYNVRLISHIGHCADTIIKQVYANILPSAVNITEAKTTCDGGRGRVIFDQHSLRASGGTWDFGDGTIIPYDTGNHNLVHTYTTSGRYNVILTSYYGACTLTSNRIIHVLLKQSPALYATNTVICSNHWLNLQVSNLVTNPHTGNQPWGQYYISSFEYSNGTPVNSSLTNTTWNYTTYTTTMQNFSPGSSGMRAIVGSTYTTCFDTTNYINLQVNGPVANFSVQTNNICFKIPFVFTDASSSATATPLTTWHWSFGDGSTQTNSTGATVTYTYTNPGDYSVQLTVTDALGCSVTKTHIAKARGPKASFTASGLYIPNVPLNTSVTFYNYTNSSYTNAVNYTWHYGDGATATTASGQYTYTQAGVYTVLLIASDPSLAACSDTARMTVTVKDFNTAFSFTTSFLGSGSCPPVLLRINNLSVGFNRLLWDFGDGTTATGQSFPTHDYNSPGRYRITLYTYGFNGLTGTYIDSIEVRSPPAATIAADALIACTSKTIALSATAQNAATYTWDFGDGTVAPGQTPVTHAYLSAGLYNPRLIVKNVNGCAASTQLADSIVIDSLYIAIKGIPPVVCDSALIHFNPDIKSFAATNLGTQLIYKWNFGTGNLGDTSNIRNPVFQYNIPGTYTVRFKVSSPYGCVKETSEIIVVNQKAIGAITALPEGCEGTGIQFTGAASPTGNLQWAWAFGNGATSTLQNPVAQIYTPGNYVVSMVVNKNGCLHTSLHNLTVHPKPVIDAQPKQAVVCLGNSVALSANGGSNYLWSPVAGLNNSTSPNPVASPIISTKYKVTVTSTKGCTNYDSVQLTVAQPIKVQMSKELALCKGSDVQLTASGATTYRWINTTTGLSNTTIPNPVATPTATTIYTVVGYDAYGCFTDSASVLVTVYNLPTVSAGPDIETQGGIPYPLSAVSSPDVVSWLWSPANTLSCNNCATPFATPKKSTTYVVKATTAQGCSVTDTVLVKLHCGVGYVHIPDAFTPNGDGRNDVFYIKGSGVSIINYIRIFNRDGNLVFERSHFDVDDRSSAWDGRYKGQPVGTATYVYVAEMECASGEPFIMKGTVTVIK